MSGRPQAVDKAAVLQVIHDTVTTSPSELAKNLNVDRATIYRRLKEIKQKEIDQALGIITEGELKPAEMKWDVFQQIPEVKNFRDTLQFVRKNTAGYSTNMVRARLCLGSSSKVVLEFSDFPSVLQLLSRLVPSA